MKKSEFGKTVDFAKKYADRFAELYDRIVFGNLVGEEILNVQYDIFLEVEKMHLQRQDGSDYGCNFVKIEESFRWLVNVLIEIYVFQGELINMYKLTTNISGPDNYDSKLIYGYFANAYLILKDKPSAKIFVCDLCLGHNQAGDLIVVKDGDVSFLEIKAPSKKNNQFLEMIRKGKSPVFDNEYDTKQYDRMRKQLERLESIVSDLEDVLYERDEEIGFPYLLELPQYDKQFKELLERKEDSLYKVYRIDECINVHIIDVIAYNAMITGSCGNVIQYCMKRYGYLPSHELMQLNTVLNRKIDGASWVDYNADVFFPDIPKIYHSGVNGKTIEKLLLGELQVYIEFDIELFFNKLRELGYSIYPKRGAREKSCVLYNNKQWCIGYNGEYQSLLYQGILNRVFYAFYTTDGIIQFIDKVIMGPLKKENTSSLSHK